VWIAVVTLAAGCGDAVRGDHDAPPAATDGVIEADNGGGDDVAEDTSAAPTACLEDRDCAHIEGCCYTGACFANQCGARSRPACCSVSGPCAVSSPLHEATCAEECVEGGCHTRLRLPEAGCGDTLWELDLAEGALPEDMAVVAPAGQRVSWHVTNRRTFEGRSTLYAGDVVCPTYHAGPLDAACQPIAPDIPTTPVHVTVATPWFDIPSERPTVVTLWLWLALEGGARGSVFDTVTVSAVETGGRIFERWSSRSGGAPRGEWFPVVVDLAPSAGGTVRLQVALQTVDGVDNHHEGVYIGAIRAFTPCLQDRTCPPATPCEVPRLAAITSLVDHLCVTATPDPGAPCRACTLDPDCTSDDPCVEARCVSGACTDTREVTPECCTPDSTWPGAGDFDDEAPLDGWTLTPEGGEAGWHLSDARAAVGATSLRFGAVHELRLAPEGEAAAGTAWSPPLHLPPDAPTLAFSLWMSTEFDAAPDPLNPAGLDLLELLIEPQLPPALSLPPTVLWDSRAIGGTTAGEWIRVAVPLPPTADHPVRVGWRFATGDDQLNDGEGVYVDAVDAYRACPTPPGEGAPVLQR